ncbi:MAG: hypothetical protein N2235_18230 [Fischerella sp.]|nr:hypothetical protein [Fischerella sp.]
MSFTTKIGEKNILVKDLNGYWYSIPSSLEEDFKIMREAIELAEWGSDEWFQRCDDFSAQFGSFIKE